MGKTIRSNKITEVGYMKNIEGLELKWSGPALLPEDVQALESHFAVSLPPDYLQFLSTVNGGAPTLNCYDYIHEDGEQGQVIVGGFNYLIADRSDIGGVWENTESLQQYMMDVAEAMRRINVVAIGRDGSINPIYLDLSVTPASVRILYVDDELLDYKIADSFEQFIDGLKYVDFSE